MVNSILFPKINTMVEAPKIMQTQEPSFYGLKELKQDLVSFKSSNEDKDITALNLLRSKDLDKFNILRKNNPDYIPNFRYADLKGMVLEGINLNAAKLLKADMEKINLIDAQLERAILGRTNLREAKLERANLANAIIIAADLTDANLKHANLRGANLENSKLTNANVVDADLHGATANLNELRNTSEESQKYLYRNYILLADTANSDKTNYKVTIYSKAEAKEVSLYP